MLSEVEVKKMSACVWGPGEVGIESMEGQSSSERHEDSQDFQISRFKKEYQLNSFLAYVWCSVIDDMV